MGEQLYITEKNGQRRGAIATMCSYCGKDILTRKDKYEKGKNYFCNKNCFHASAKNSVEFKCWSCGKEFDRSKSHIKKSKSGLYFCSIKCKNFAQSYKAEKNALWLPHYGSKQSVPKNLIKRTTNPKCCDCEEDRRYLLVVHHKDGDNKNNIKDNLEIVCYNCHAKRHLYKMGNKWVNHTSSLTNRDILKSL